MSAKPSKILTIAAAVTALASTAALLPNNAYATTTAPNDIGAEPAPLAPELKPNRLISVGQDMLGFTVTHAADGTMLAYHYSHVSHSSHVSHTSHYSSRY